MKRKLSPPRNHVVVAMMKRQAGSGAHEKTKKAQRMQDKIELKRVCNSEAEYLAFNQRVEISKFSTPTINQNAFQRSAFRLMGSRQDGLRHRVLIPTFP